MKINKRSADKIEKAIEANRKMLIAFGEESRQQLLVLMLSMDSKEIRSSELAEKTNLSRPAVSHHMQILKDAGLLKSRKEGRKIYYSFNPDVKKLDSVIQLIESVKEVIKLREE